jgi:hypothetical protein
MKFARIAMAVAAATAIASASGALPGGAALAATGHARMSHRQTVIVSCENKWQVRPGSYLLACGDGSSYFAKLRWSSWTSTEATATGRFLLNGCSPNCAQGKWYNSQVLVVLWKTSAMPRHPRQREFMRMTVIYTGKRPAHSSQTFTESLWYPVVR